MAEVYDRLMFQGATYADLKRQGLPMISANATDIAGGIAFPFNQPSFDLLCSDLDTFPVARAVAASNGFPVVFSPVTLDSFRRDCLAHPPPGAPAAARTRTRIGCHAGPCSTATRSGSSTPRGPASCT